MRTVCDARYRYIRNFTPERPFLQANEYKEKSYPVWNLLKELNAAGKLTPVQARLCAATMPEEELYDLEKDPHQIDNLANKPEHQATRERLRKALMEWIETTHDQGRTPEPPDVIRRKGATKPETPLNTKLSSRAARKGRAPCSTAESFSHLGSQLACRLPASPTSDTILGSGLPTVTLHS